MTGKNFLRHSMCAIRLLRIFVLGGFAAAIVAATAHASNESRPYDQDLLRLSEILGSLHYLRAVCDTNDGQLWRNQMEAILSAEGSSALRRVVLTRQFNRGFTNYSRTYRQCTAAAKTAIERFLTEAEALSNRLLRDGVAGAGPASSPSATGATSDQP